MTIIKKTNIIDYNFKHQNWENMPGLRDSKCLCKKCRWERLGNVKTMSAVKPDLSRAAEMERRKQIHENKNIW